MLVLSRKAGESILVGGIEIKVTEIGKDKVKLGIEAPKDCRILRKELTEIIAENRQAAQTDLPSEGLRSLLHRLK
ncbi:MAG: carbon storage regulator CsrA [Oscillospiraceae bacterium]|nr:carbon storage regulator CsrA [Oscillospiraceae bacterium]